MNKASGLEDCEPSGNFGRYLSGKKMPSRTIGPIVRSPWLERVDALVPGASNIFRSPLWYLLDRDQDSTIAELLQCIELLPEEERECLLLPGTEHLPAPYRIQLPSETDLFWIISRDAAWHYGFLACVFRAAELRGDSNLARRALLCLIQGIDLRLSLAEENAWSRPVEQELGQHVREFFAEWQFAMTASHKPVQLSAHLLEHRQFEDGYIMRRREFKNAQVEAILNADPNQCFSA
ncbi:hypothetical protein [Hydrogenophaga sp. RWCD_12]|uniref:hypothetical protein n=1 Tax=Hydrogenophaga sp. RWCD_12 TaxID=3391190 RepID=UPI003984A916